MATMPGKVLDNMLFNLAESVNAEQSVCKHDNVDNIEYNQLTYREISEHF